MTDIQRLVVDDHIRRLTDEGAARRAERELARRRQPSAEPSSATPDVEGHSFTAPTPNPASAATSRRPITDSPRVRVGRWVMGIGTTIAGTDQAVAVAVRRAAADSALNPCGEDPKPLSRAA